MDLEPKLVLHKVVPLFTLPDKYGETHNLAKRRGREHLLIVIVGLDAQPQAYLQALAARADDWRKLPARGIVVVTTENCAGALGALPFAILIDADGRVRDRFLPAGAGAGVFALDRYGALYQQWLGADTTVLPDAAEIDGWLEAISMQCSI